MAERNLLIRFRSEASSFLRDLETASGSADRFRQGLTGIAVVSGAVSAATIALGKTAIDSGSQFEQLFTRLKTTLGGESAATAAFKTIQAFAVSTPYTVEQVTQSFISLKNRGIDPTNETLRKLGDLASSQGKGLQQITEAVLDASQKEGERLKEFGINASFAGDKAVLSFKGVNKTVAATPQAISEAVIAFGDLKGVAGGMEAQSLTLEGKLSNLSDSTDSVSRTFYELAGEPVKLVVTGITNLINGFTSLPAPIQKAILLAGALTGAIATVTAALTGLVLAQNLESVQLTISTAKTILQTGADRGLAAAKLALALATGTATASQQALAVATAANTAAFAGVAIAGLAVVDTYLKVDAAAAKTRASTQSVKDALVGLREVQLAEKDAAAGAQLQASAYERTREEVGGFQRALDDIIRGPIPGLATATETSIERQKVAFGDLISVSDDVLEEFNLLKSKGLSLASPEKLEAEKKAIDAAIASLQASIPVDAAAASSKAFYLKQLEQASLLLGNTKKATDEATKAQQKQTDALTESTTAYQKSTSEIATSASEKRAALLENLLRQGKDAEAGAKQLAAIEKQSIEDRLQAAGEQLIKLSFLKVGEKDPAKLEKINAEILKLEGEVTSGRISLAQTELSERKRIEDERFAKILEGVTKAKDLVVKGAEQQRVALLESLVSQGKDLQSATGQFAAIEEKSLRDRIATNSTAIATLNKAKAGLSPEDLKRINDQIESLENDSLQARSSLANNALNEAKRIEDEKKQATEKRVAKQNELEQKALDKVKESQSLALEAVKQSENGRLIAIQTALNKGLISEEAANAQRLDSKRTQLNDELFATQELAASLEALPKFSDPEKEKQRQSEIRAARAQASQFTLQLLENERTKQEQYKKDLIKGIEDRAAADKNRSDRAVANLDKEKAAQDLILATIERQNKLTDSRLGVVKAQNNLEQVTSQNNIDSLKRAQEIRKQLDDDTEESAQVRATLESELIKLSGLKNATELELIKRRQTAEDKLISQQAAARATEQAAQRAALESEIIRNKILGDRALLESRIAEIKAKQQLAESEVELQKALLDGDARQIANAQKLVELAKQGVGLAAQNVTLSGQQVADQTELANNSRQQLNLEQQATNTNAKSSNITRENAQTEELVRAGGNASNNRFTPVTQNAIPIIPIRSPLIPPSSPLSHQVAASQSTIALPEFKGDVSAILAQLKTLNTGIIQLAKTPRIVSVSSPEPVSDAVKILGDLARMSTQSAGL